MVKSEKIALATISPGYRINIPRKVVHKMDLKEGEHLGFYEVGGDIILKKMKLVPDD